MYFMSEVPIWVSKLEITFPVFVSTQAILEDGPWTKYRRSFFLSQMTFNGSDRIPDTDGIVHFEMAALFSMARRPALPSEKVNAVPYAVECADKTWPAKTISSINSPKGLILVPTVLPSCIRERNTTTEPSFSNEGFSFEFCSSVLVSQRRVPFMP